MKHKILLLVIILLGFFLRLYQVPTVPPSLSWDEVSIGYNAYSILKTGRDEHGTRFPLTAFAAYGDYKPVVPIYLTIPAIAVFGLSEFAVRLPSVIAGALTIPVVYFLVLELFPASNLLALLALLSSLVLAVSPWHINLSRAGFEANIATFFIGLGVWLVIRARKIPKLWIYSLLPFVLAINTFNSARYFSPILAAGLVIFCWSQIKKNIKVFVLGIVIAGICASPLVPYLLSKEARLRFNEVNIFSDIRVVETSNARIAADGGTWWASIVHNRRIGYAREYLVHFLDNLEPRFLFIRGDGNPKFSIQDVGQLYLIEFPLLLLGIYWMFRFYPRVAGLLLFWLIASIIPAAVARETPHALRIENSLPTWHIFVASGIYALVSSAKRFKKLIIVGLVFLYVFSVSFYLHNYYGYYPIEYSGEWQYGYREAIRYVMPIKDSYKQVVMTDTIGRPYMYTLFYGAYDPEMYWRTKDASFDAAGFLNVAGFDTFKFIRGGKIEELNKDTLYILPPTDVPAGAHVLHTVNLLNGNPILVIFDIR